MINNRYRRYVHSFLLVLPMTGLVTAINTIVASDAAAVLTMAMLERWAISLAIAFPAVLLVAPLALKLTDKCIKCD
jgi:hypothetical protein